MAYKRQTSFSPFSSKRSVSNKEAKDQQTLAKALESQRKQTVKEFAGASSQQIEELGRIDKIARQKDQYEINELAKFSKSLNSALQTGSRVLGKQYIDGQREKGADAFADDPFDPLAIEQEISALRDKNLSVLDEIEKQENDKKILNLEEKIKLHESRMKRGQWGVGYTKAYLQEVGNGFLPHLNSTVSGDDSWFKEPDIDPVTLEPIEGTGIKFSEYYAQDLATKKKMEQQIFLLYKEKHNLDDINKKFVNQYLNEPAAKILNKWAANELNKSIIENAEKELNGFSSEVTSLMSEWGFTEIPEEVTDENAEGYKEYQKYLKLKTSITNNIQHFLNHVPTAFNSRGVPEGKTANSATSALLRSSLIDALIDIPSDVSRDTLLDIILGDEEEGIEAMKFKTSIGVVPLTTFADFDKDDIIAAVNKAIVDEFNAKKTSEQVVIESDLRKAISQFNSDGDIVALNQAYLTAQNNDFYIKETHFGNKIDGLYNGALSGKDTQLDDKESKKEVENLQKAGYQVIPMSVAVEKGINFKTIQKYQKEGIIAEPGDELYLEENKDVVADYSQKIAATFLDKATGGHSSNKDYIISNSLYLKAAEELSTNELLIRSNTLLNDPTFKAKYSTITDGEELRGLALKEAFNEIIQLIPKLDTEEIGEDHWLGSVSGRDYRLQLIEDGDFLTEFKNQQSWIPAIDTTIGTNAEEIANHVSAYFEKDGFTVINDGGILSTYNKIPPESKIAILEPGKVNINGEELYNDFPEFTILAAKEDATGVSALQIWNAERATMGLEEVTPEMLAPHLQKVAAVENLLTRDDKIEIQNGHIDDVLDRKGLISISYLTNAFKNEFNEGNFKIDPVAIKKYAETLGIEYSFLYNKDGSINPEAEVLWDNINRHHVNNLLVDATKDVNNKQEALQNFYALASGKSRNHWKNNIVFESKGVDFFEDYNSNGAKLANYDVAYNILSDKELTIPLKNFKEFNGKNFKISELEGTINFQAEETARIEKETFDKINTEEGFEAAYEWATRNMKVNTVEDLQTELEEMRDDTEGVDFSTRSTQNYTTPSYNKWISNITKKQSQINVVSLLSGGQGDINWGLQQSIDSRRNTKNYLTWIFSSASKIFPPTWTTDYRVVSDIINVIGDKEWEALKKEAADNAGITAPPESFQMKFIPGALKEPIEEAFVDEVYKLLIMRPEFYIGEFKE